MNEQQQKEAIRLARNGNKRGTIAKRIGVHPRTIDRWLVKGMDPDAKVRYIEFALLFNQAVAAHEEKLVSQLGSISDEGDVGATKYLLEKVHGWGDTAVVERVVTRFLEYLFGKVEPALFQEILSDIENGAISE